MDSSVHTNIRLACRNRPLGSSEGTSACTCVSGRPPRHRVISQGRKFELEFVRSGTLPVRTSSTYSMHDPQRLQLVARLEFRSPNNVNWAAQPGRPLPMACRRPAYVYYSFVTTWISWIAVATMGHSMEHWTGRNVLWPEPDFGFGRCRRKPMLEINTSIVALKLQLVSASSFFLSSHRSQVESISTQK